MATDLLVEDQEETLPIFQAFDRELPEKLQTPKQTLNDWLGELDRHTQEFEEAAKNSGNDAEIKRAQGYRAAFQDLEKKALKEMNASKKDDKKMTALTETVRETYDLVDAELAVPECAARVVKELKALKDHGKPALNDKIVGFEKEQQEIAKEKDPKKRLTRYAKLERDISKAGMLARRGRSRLNLARPGWLRLAGRQANQPSRKTGQRPAQPEEQAPRKLGSSRHR